jgi:hypothetical protein
VITFCFVFQGQNQDHHILKQDEAIKHVRCLLKEKLSIFADTDLPHIQQNAHNVYNVAQSLSMDNFTVDAEG